jgi:hypothetical protein
MRAYIKLMQEGNGWKAEIVTEQDYHERGPFARSYLSPWQAFPEDAEKLAKDEATREGYTIVEAKDI